MKKIVVVLTIVVILIVAFSIIGTLNKSATTTIDIPSSSVVVSDPKNEETTIKDTPKVTANKAKLKSEIDKYMSDKTFSGTLLVGIGDKIYFENSYGHSNVEKNEKNTNDTIYEIGSITKQFTATGIMLLQEQGKLSLNDKLSKYYPEISFADNVTIKQMLNMTSGIPDYLNDVLWDVESGKIKLQDEYTKKQFLEAMSKRDLQFIPEESWRYSNSDYYFLGLIIEDVSGKKYEEFIEDNIIMPVNMKSTSLEMPNATAKGYLDKDNLGFNVKSSYFFSAGEIVSTASDVFKWQNAFINGNIISKDSVKQALTDCGYYYGFGWFLENEYVFHTGNTMAFYSIDIIEQKHDIKIVALSNFNDKETGNLGKEVLAITQKQLFNYVMPEPTETTDDLAETTEE